MANNGNGGNPWVKWLVVLVVIAGTTAAVWFVLKNRGSEAQYQLAQVTRGGPALAAAGEAADNHESRSELSAHYEGVLRKEIPRELLRVPFLFDRQFGAQSIEKVASAIAGSS